MSKKCNKCKKQVEGCSDREVCNLCFLLACQREGLALQGELESVAESLNDAIEFTGSMVSKEKRDKWTKARDAAWNLLRSLEK